MAYNNNVGRVKGGVPSTPDEQQEYYSLFQPSGDEAGLETIGAFGYKPGSALAAMLRDRRLAQLAALQARSGAVKSEAELAHLQAQAENEQAFAEQRRAETISKYTGTIDNTQDRTFDPQNFDLTSALKRDATGHTVQYAAPTAKWSTEHPNYSRSWVAQLHQPGQPVHEAGMVAPGFITTPDGQVAIDPRLVHSTPGTDQQLRTTEAATQREIARHDLAGEVEFHRHQLTEEGIAQANADTTAINAMYKGQGLPSEIKLRGAQTRSADTAAERNRFAVRRGEALLPLEEDWYGRRGVSKEQTDVQKTKARAAIASQMGDIENKVNTLLVKQFGLDRDKRILAPRNQDGTRDVSAVEVQRQKLLKEYHYFDIKKKFDALFDADIPTPVPIPTPKPTPVPIVPPKGLAGLTKPRPKTTLVPAINQRQQLTVPAARTGMNFAVSHQQTNQPPVTPDQNSQQQQWYGELSKIPSFGAFIQGKGDFDQFMRDAQMPPPGGFKSWQEFLDLLGIDGQTLISDAPELVMAERKRLIDQMQVPEVQANQSITGRLSDILKFGLAQRYVRGM